MRKFVIILLSYLTYSINVDYIRECRNLYVDNEKKRLCLTLRSYQELYRDCQGDLFNL